MTVKISLVVDDLSESGAGRWGGGAVRPFLLAQALKTLKYEVEIVGLLFGNDHRIPSLAGIPIVALPGKRYPTLLFSALRLLGKIEADVIYAVKPKPTSFGASLAKRLTATRPVVLDIDDWELSWHGGDQWKYRPTLRQFAMDILKKDGALRFPNHPLYLKWMEGLVCRADAITINTQFLKQRFGGVYVPSGKDTSLFDPQKYDPEASRIRYGLSRFRVLMFPGAPRPHKGLEDVLSALDELQEPDLRLVIVGGNPYDDYDDRLIERWKRWIIKLPNHSFEEMPHVLSAAHVVVVPQRDTPIARAQFPLKLTDGMAMAKPVLSTRVGDIPDILGDTGYLVDPGSPNQIVEKIQWIFRHLEEANDRGMKARERCIERYSLDAMGVILSDVIARL